MFHCHIKRYERLREGTPEAWTKLMGPEWQSVFKAIDGTSGMGW